MITLKRLTQDDWQTYRDIRLESLREEPLFFGGRIHIEEALTEADWRARLSGGRQNAVWCLCDDDTPVGLTGAVQQRDDPDGALLVASYIRRPYRGRGHSALYYQARIEWARGEGFKYIDVAHRKGNDASRAANQKAGFQYTHTESALWPDGTHDDKICYRLIL